MNTIEVKDMDIKIELNGLITTIIGPSNSGKTVLAKRLCNKIDNSSIYIDNICIRDYAISLLKESIAVVLDDNNFRCELVKEELIINLALLGLSERVINERLNNLSNYFKIKELLDKRIEQLYLCDKVLIKILSLLIIEPEVFILDNLLSYLTEDKKAYLLKFVKTKKISFINITTNQEDILLADHVIVLNNFKCVLSGNYKSILEGNSILPYMGLKLPFIADLSHNLILYNVVDKIYYDEKRLVDKLWK